FGLIVKMVLEPTPTRIAAALIASVASVQYLLYGSVLLLAIAAGVLTVAFVRRRWRLALAITGIGAASLASVLPYVGPFSMERQSSGVLTGPVTMGWFWTQLESSFGEPMHLMTMIWLGLFTAA